MRKPPSTPPPVREFADRGVQWLLASPENLRGLLLALAPHLCQRLLILNRREREEGEALMAKIARETHAREVTEMAKTWAEELIEEGMERGREEGREEGRERGRLEAKREMLLGLLQGKFGPLPTAVPVRVYGIEDASLLDEYGLRLLGANSLADVGL